jgi:hypothetical protein
VYIKRYRYVNLLYNTSENPKKGTALCRWEKMKVNLKVTECGGFDWIHLEW